MTKAEIVKQMSTRTGVEPEIATACMDALLDIIKDALIHDGHIHFRDFGTFFVKRRAPKIARNITTNTAIQLPERYVPVFKPTKMLAAMINDADK
jgi:DNA-binding protein HU-beta